MIFQIFPLFLPCALPCLQLALLGLLQVGRSPHFNDLLMTTDVEEDFSRIKNILKVILQCNKISVEWGIPGTRISDVVSI